MDKQTNEQTIIQNTQLSDISSIILLQKKVYPSIPCWREEMLRHQLEIFPQGQLVAEIDGHLVGAASSLVISWNQWAVQHTWKDITAHGSFDTHNPQGLTHGAEVFISPTMRGSGIGHALSRKTAYVANSTLRESSRVNGHQLSSLCQNAHRIICTKGRLGRYP